MMASTDKLYAIVARRMAPRASAELARMHGHGPARGRARLAAGQPIGEPGRAFAVEAALAGGDPEAEARAWLARFGDNIELVSVEPVLPDDAVDARLEAEARRRAAAGRRR